MAKLSPISRNKLIKKLRKLGFEGPFVATRHQYMLKEKQKIYIPNPHEKILRCRFCDVSSIS